MGVKTVCIGFPRASGDGPYEQFTHRVQELFPPRERGWSMITG